MRAVITSPKLERNLVGFSVGNVEYAVPVQAVREVILAGAMTELPHTPRAVVGVADHRGAVVPIIDLRQRFGLPPPAVAGRGRWVLVALENQLVGLVVDAVSGVFSMPSDELGPLPALGGGDEERGLEGVTSYQGRLVFVLDLSSIADLARGIGDATSSEPRGRS